MAIEHRLSYTASQIDERLGRIDRLASKSELPTKTSDLINDSDFATESSVDEKIDDAISNIPSTSTEDVLEFVIEMGYANPIINDSNQVYTDNNNNVYIL